MFGNKSKKLLEEKEEELMVVQNELFTLKTKHEAVEADLHQTKIDLQIAEADLKRSTDDYAALINKYSPVINIEKTVFDRKKRSG